MGNPSGMFEFAGFGEVAETTLQLLSLSLRAGANAQSQLPPARDNDLAAIDQVTQLIFQQARDYLGAAKEGFVLSVRSSEIPDRFQLRYLVDQVLLDWDAFSAALGLEDDCAATPNADGPTEGLIDTATVTESVEVLEPVHQQLLAFGMAAVAMGALPRMPAEQVTFPHSYGKPPTYADIAAPSSPAEMLVRIEELEEMIWQLMAGNPDDLVQSKYGPVRRTYGFFETSAWLVRQEVERFGIKKQTDTLAYF